MGEYLDTLEAFVRDGGDPWVIWQIEEAFLGGRLEEIDPISTLS